MGKRIIPLVVVAGILLIGYLWYNNSKGDQSMETGEVHSIGSTSKSSSTPDDYTQPNSKNNINTPAPSQTSNQPPGGAPEPAPDTPTAAVQPTPATVPTRDTLSPNAPNGVAFAGNGRYQWYRQGNLTWRIDTQSGDSCIAFATDDEWRKQRVYERGCSTR